VSLVNASELDTSPPEWLVGDNSGGITGMIPRMGTGFAWGRRTAGKSLVFGIDLGLAVANGAFFLGHPTVRGKVVYCVGEGLYDLGVRKQARLARQARDNALATLQVMQDQGAAAAESFASTLPAYTDERLHVMTEPFTVPLLSTREQTASLKQAISTISQLNTPGPDDDPETFDYVDLIILDSLADFTGRSLSNDASANLITGGLKALARELQCFVLAIAHPTEKGDRMLGAGRLLNAADTEIEVQPDDVSSPGSPKSASVICHKSKYGAEFDTVGYRIEPCEWDEPGVDDDGYPTGETVRVKSATIRLIEDSTCSRPDPKDLRVQAPREYPELRDTQPVRPRKRSGLRPQARPGLHSVPDLPGSVPAVAVARKEERPLDARVSQPLTALAANPDRLRYFARVILAEECPGCLRPGGEGCKGKAGTYLLGHSESGGEQRAHEDRVLAAAEASPDPEVFLEKALALFSLSPVMPPAPAPVPVPKPVMSALDRRLSWTTVRPDSPAPTLAQVLG
jgi:AAA domain